MNNQKRPRGPQKPGPGGQGQKPPQKYNRSPFSWLIIALIVFFVIYMIQSTQTHKIPLIPDFMNYVENGYVKEIVIHPHKFTGMLNEQGINELGEDAQQSFEVNYNKDILPENFFTMLDEKDIETRVADQDIWVPILINVLPILILVAIIYFVFLRGMRGAGGGGMLMSFGRSKHRMRNQDANKVTFADVAGIDEAKEEVSETIEFLKNPKKFRKIGGRIPRGVLLVGPPGCGKTLLAKAIAGEAEVPFFTIAGSDFVEMFVGVGASRVRDLFKQAKDNSPCIIFLDEIDAIGRKRGPGFVSGGHDEREQTLNAILVEMDGFETNDQVIVIAATNRGDILDNALTRPGRFDRQVVVPLPDLKGRQEILKVHAKKVKMGPDINLDRIARGTPMFSGAELEALINEAAIGASMEEKDHVEMADMEEARDKVRWGRAKRSRIVDETDKRLTAYHEAGHALVQYMLEDADPLHKVSIIPRGPMGGATFALPEKDRTYYTKKYCVAQMQVCFAGRIAEELFCEDISSGAQSDIQIATQIAKEMVTKWGMGEKVGPIDYSGDERDYFGGGRSDYSETTAELIDREIKKLIDASYQAAHELIGHNREKLESLAQGLIKFETLDVQDVKTILEGGEIQRTTVADLLAAEQKRSEEKQPGGESDNGEPNAERQDTPDTEPEQDEVPKETH